MGAKRIRTIGLVREAAEVMRQEDVVAIILEVLASSREKSEQSKNHSVKRTESGTNHLLLNTELNPIFATNPQEDAVVMETTNPQIATTTAAVLTGFIFQIDLSSIIPNRNDKQKELTTIAKLRSNALTVGHLVYVTIAEAMRHMYRRSQVRTPHRPARIKAHLKKNLSLL